tara:strand:+ start:1048 stop:1341 length:294 start_codon:yes stop_codon:yes gene_type:complete
MPTATAAKKSTTTSRKRRTRKVTATAPKSAPLNTSTAKIKVEDVKEAPKVTETVVTKTWIERAKELDGFDVIMLPLLLLEAGTKELLKALGTIKVPA